MRILLLYTLNQGLLSGFFTDVAKRLVIDGHDVCCYSLKSKPKIFNDSGVYYHIEKRKGYFSNYFKIFNVIKKFKPDVVVSNFSYVNPALLFGKAFGVKKNVAWFHSLNEQTAASASNIFIKKQFLRLSDVIIANSHITKEQVHKVYKIPQKQILALPFWTPIQSTEEAKPHPSIESYKGYIKIGCPGRLVAHKNHRIVVQAIAELNKLGCNKTVLFIAGSGEERVALEKQAITLNVSDQVVFLEHLTHNDMVTYYKSMNVVVLPSLHEAFGLVFIEAIALGTPVVVSENFGALSFIDSKIYDLSGITFDPKSVENLVEKLLPYCKGMEANQAFFKKLYSGNFHKDTIYRKLHSLLTS